MSLDQNNALPLRACNLRLYQLGNELRPEPMGWGAVIAGGLYQLGNELRPERRHRRHLAVPGLYQLGNELRPELGNNRRTVKHDCIS